MPRKEARHCGAFARQLDRVFLRAPTKRKKFTRTPTRQLKRGGATADELQERQQRRRAKLNAMTAEDRGQLLEQRNDEAWGQHAQVGEDRRKKAALKQRADAEKKGSVRWLLAGTRLNKLEGWEKQEAMDNALSPEDKTEQVTALIDAAMNGDFARVKGSDALDRDYYRYWLEGVSPKLLELFDRASRKGSTQANDEAAKAELVKKTEQGYVPQWGAKKAELRSQQSEAQHAEEAARIEQSRRDIADGIGTEQDIRNVYFYDRKDRAQDVVDDLKGIFNVTVELVRDNLHEAVSNETANHVMDAVSLAAAADPTGASEIVSGVWQGMQAVDVALQYVPHVDTNADTEQQAWVEQAEGQGDARRGNVRNLVTGGSIWSGVRRRRACALASRGRHH
jgi:hypothetical protein